MLVRFMAIRFILLGFFLSVIGASRAPASIYVPNEVIQAKLAESYDRSGRRIPALDISIRLGDEPYFYWPQCVYVIKDKIPGARFSLYYAGIPGCPFTKDAQIRLGGSLYEIAYGVNERDEYEGAYETDERGLQAIGPCKFPVSPKIRVVEYLTELSRYNGPGSFDSDAPVPMLLAELTELTIQIPLYELPVGLLEDLKSNKAFVVVGGFDLSCWTVGESPDSSDESSVL
jgi:hypothetical protein